MKEISWEDIRNGDIITWANVTYLYGCSPYPYCYLMLNKDIMGHGQCINISTLVATWLNPENSLVKFLYVDHIDLDCLELPEENYFAAELVKILEQQDGKI